MLVTEHDAKEIVSRLGDVPVPAGVLVRAGANLCISSLPEGPWVVKAQVASGKRGKAGGIVRCETLSEVADAVRKIADISIGGHPPEWVRVESAVKFVAERYLSIMVDPGRGQLRLIYCEQGGIDVEEAPSGSVRSVLVGCTPDEFARGARELASGIRDAEIIHDAVTKLGRAFYAAEATLVEINPLFMLQDGRWIAGDCKLILDDAAAARNDVLTDLVSREGDRYPDTRFKLTEGFDLLVLDPEGEVGLLTTGAGLTMMLLDELSAKNVRLFNFCDIRTGQIHGDPARLVTALRMIKSGVDVKRLLINVFAGITDLRNFAIRFLEAAEIVSLDRMDIVVRLVGLNRQDAVDLFQASKLKVTIVEDLDEAITALAA
jgi:succinyl-CoA synthetase beta subunit